MSESHCVIPLSPFGTPAIIPVTVMNDCRGEQGLGIHRLDIASMTKSTHRHGLDANRERDDIDQSHWYEKSPLGRTGDWVPPEHLIRKIAVDWANATGGSCCHDGPQGKR